MVAGGRFAAPATARLVDLISAIAKDGGPIWMDLRQVTSLDLTSARLLSELCARRGSDVVRLVGPPDVVLVNLVIADAGRFIWHIAELDEKETELVEEASRQAFNGAGRT